MLAHVTLFWSLNRRDRRAIIVTASADSFPQAKALVQHPCALPSRRRRLRAHSFDPSLSQIRSLKIIHSVRRCPTVPRMPQAFLSHFPHAVPSIVLKDLRRTFHRNEGGETWTIASPPRPPRGAGRASPEPAPSPSPSPMRLTTPDLGAFSDVAMGAVDSCAWMGKDPGSNLMDEEGGEAMVREI